jgi:hypothetical protein
MASITLPRPSRKVNLANVGPPIPVKIIGPKVAEQEGRKRKEKEEKRG